jgi:cell division protein FtsW (lipid II flippase)
MTSLLIAVLQLLVQAASSTASTSPRRLEFVTEPHRDFVFSIVGDDFSLVGIGISLLILLLVIRYIRRRRPKSGSLKQ